MFEMLALRRVTMLVRISCFVNIDVEKREQNTKSQDEKFAVSPKIKKKQN